ncbi:hypothetical protein C8Q80DRAFT_599209 [Daedaleopsis nitida]|nr:hypothetical protein C8Q80DRAFT_599209 [Daedaleopsis nitida]
MHWHPASAVTKIICDPSADRLRTSESVCSVPPFSCKAASQNPDHAIPNGPWDSEPRPARIILLETTMMWVQ